MHAWRSLVSGVRDAVETATGPRDRPAPTTPFGDLESGGRRPLPGLATDDPMVRDVMLSRIRRRDPGFDADAFVRGAVAAFLAVEGAWSDRDPQRSRQYLTRSLWSSHRSRMELYALQGRRNRLDGLTVRGAQICGASTGDGPDRVTVRIDARSTDYDVDASGAVVRGDTALFDWREDWVFERSGESTTPAAGGVLAQRCPGCGAPLDLDDEGCCTSCHAPVMDGSRDWVVVAVERPDEDRRRLDAVLGVERTTVRDAEGRDVTTTTVAPIPLSAVAASVVRHAPEAVAVIRAADPDFASDELCSHARSAFVALRRAWGEMDADRARPFLSEPAYEALRLAVSDVASHGLHRVADDPLVDGVRIAAATDADGFLTVDCDVTAELVDADADASGKLVRGGGSLQHVSCLLRFRRHDLAKSAGAGVTIMRCPRCGAPLKASVLEPCAYCRQAVSDGGGAWALADVGPLLPAHPAVTRSWDAGPTPPGTAPPAAIAALTSADPSINAYELLAGARETFFEVEKSMVALDARRVAGRLTPGALAAHVDRIGRLRAGGLHVRMAFLDLTGAVITGSSIGSDGTARVTVRFSVSGDDSAVDASGMLVEGSGGVHGWTEDWDLIRTAPTAPWLVDVIRPDGAPAGATPAAVGPPTA